MTLSDTATARLWETFRAGGGAGLIREVYRIGESSPFKYVNC